MIDSKQKLMISEKLKEGIEWKLKLDFAKNELKDEKLELNLEKKESIKGACRVSGAYLCHINKTKLFASSSSFVVKHWLLHQKSNL